MREKIKVKGMVTVRVLDKDGNVKRNKQGIFRRLLRIKGRPMLYQHHNIVTRTGDALIADALLPNPNKAKVSSASGFIQVGTGWTGNSTKTNTNCNTPTGAAEELDENYPVLKAAWGSVGDTTICYRTTFEAGDLNANGINEAALLNGSGSGAACLAYAQITPSVNVTSADTLQVVWEITILGQ
ncbi:MAG: hypothetical protein LBV68_06490 [Spirochaetaceae bacterium]|jgi:hypothetical protein|nr:hypothetical protein [Spirochaetaceae bacterium]